MVSWILFEARIWIFRLQKLIITAVPSSYWKGFAGVELCKNSEYKIFEKNTSSLRFYRKIWSNVIRLSKSTSFSIRQRAIQLLAVTDVKRKLRNCEVPDWNDFISQAILTYDMFVL